MILLRRRAGAAAREDLGAVLSNACEPPALRALAARNLARLGSPESVPLLDAEAQRTDDVQVLRALVDALGEIGDERSLPALQAVAARSPAWLACSARFAATIIAHRRGLSGHSADLPEHPRFVAIPAPRSRSIDVHASKPEEIERALAELDGDDYGIEISRQHALRLQAEGQSWHLLLNRAFVDTPAALAALAQRKTLLGLIAERNEEEEHLFTSLVILTTPTPGASCVLLHVHSPDGALLYLGEAPHKAGGVFRLRTVSRSGALPLELRGRLTAAGLAIESAVMADVPVPKRRVVRRDRR